MVDAHLADDPHHASTRTRGERSGLRARAVGQSAVLGERQGERRAAGFGMRRLFEGLRRAPDGLPGRRNAAAPPDPPLSLRGSGLRRCGSNYARGGFDTRFAYLPASSSRVREQVVDADGTREEQRLFSMQACGASSLAAAGFGPACVASSRAG